MKGIGMDTRLPQDERTSRIVLVLIEGTDFTKEQRAAIRRRLDILKRPKVLNLERAYICGRKR